MVFILALGNGVCCCGNSSAESPVFFTVAVFFEGIFSCRTTCAVARPVRRLGAGGGGAGGPALTVLFDIIGGGGGGAAGILLGAVGSFGKDGAAPSTTNDANGDAIKWLVGVCGASDCFRFGLEMSPRQCGQVNFWMLGVRNSRVESSRFSSNVARCTNVSAVSQMISLIGSLGSMRSKCCKILRNGISCGVSATYANMSTTNGQLREFILDTDRIDQTKIDTDLTQNGIEHIQMRA